MGSDKQYLAASASACDQSRDRAMEQTSPLFRMARRYAARPNLRSLGIISIKDFLVDCTHTVNRRILKFQNLFLGLCLLFCTFFWLGQENEL